jgi:hypothetical protein
VKVTPKSDKQLKEAMLMPIGEYDFQVTEAEEKDSSKGNPMIALKLDVFMEDGKVRFQRDWLMTSSPSMEYKFRPFCEAVGILDLYESGNVDAQALIGRGGRVSIGQQDDKKYGPQNTVKDYVVPEAGEKPAATPKRQPAGVIGSSSLADDDSIPF